MSSVIIKKKYLVFYYQLPYINYLNKVYRNIFAELKPDLLFLGPLWVIEPGKYSNYGDVAQLGEHHVRNVGVGGSNPLISTKKNSPISSPFNIFSLGIKNTTTAKLSSVHPS